MIPKSQNNLLTDSGTTGNCCNRVFTCDVLQCHLWTLRHCCRIFSAVVMHLKGNDLTSHL